MNDFQRILIADESVSITDLLDHLGIEYRSIPCSIPCPVHISVHTGGTEMHPSARVYEDNRRLWCYTCGKQFAPTEIYAAVRGVLRSVAAREISQEWSIPSDQAQAIIKESRTPKKTNVSKALLSSAENTLIQYRHRVPLGVYRVWAARVDELAEVLSPQKIDDQKRALNAFKIQLSREMERALKGDQDGQEKENRAKEEGSS